MTVEDLKERARLAWESLNGRERVLVGVMGGVLALTLLGLPLVLMSMTNQDIAAENDRLQSLLQTIAEQRDQLEKRAAERDAIKKLYERDAPPLGGFVENQAREAELSIRESVDQPEKKYDRFRRRGVRVTFSNVALTPVLEMMASIADSPYPVAIDYVQIEHYQKGDKYNVKLGVIAFDKTGSKGEGEPTAEAGRGRGTKTALSTQ